MSQSFDSAGSPLFRVRKLSTVSQNIFQNSFDFVSNTLDDKDNVHVEPSTARDREMLIERRIACCHFMELIFFMFSFLVLMWLHEVSLLFPFSSQTYLIKSLLCFATIYFLIHLVLCVILF